jgi:hypothetical protein
MKLTFLPTLTDLREMLGDRLYVEFVWMWRDQEQTARSQERRAKWADLMPARTAEAWPEPVFARAGLPESAMLPGPMPAQVALHPSVQRLLEQKAAASGPAASVQDDEPGAGRARTAAYRSAAE